MIMSKCKVLLTVLTLMSGIIYATEPVPTLQELVAQKIIKEKDVRLDYLPDYFDDLGLDVAQLSPKVQQAFISAIKHRFKEQLDKLFITTLSGHTGRIYALAISPDTTYIATVSRDGIAKVWNSKTGQLIHDLIGHTSGILSVTISSDNQYIVTYSLDDTVKVWDSKTGQLFCTFDHNDCVRQLAISSDNQFIVTCSDDNKAKVWDSKTGQLFLTLNHSNQVSNIAISPDSSYIVTSESWSNTVKVWDSKTGQLIHNNFIIVFDGLNTKILDSQTGQLLYVFDHGIAVSRDNTYIVTDLRVWSRNTGQLLHTLGHNCGSTSLAISHDSRYIVAGYYDGTVTVWDMRYFLNTLTLPELLAQIKSKTSRQ